MTYISIKLIPSLSCYNIFRGDHIVPNMDEAFPKKKDDVKSDKDKQSSVRNSLITIIHIFKPYKGV